MRLSQRCWRAERNTIKACWVAHSTPFDAGYQKLLGNLTGYYGAWFRAMRMQ